MYRKILLSCLLLVAFFTSCDKETPSGVIVDIEDDFYINMFEDISSGTARFQIDLSTIKEQDCLNYAIIYDLDTNVVNRAIELTINDLLEPEDCIEGMTTTHTIIPMPTLASNLYTFNINLKDAIINEGTLRVTDNRYELEMDTDDGIEIVNSTLYKIPRNTIWGYVAYNNGISADSAADFITNLTSLSTVFGIDNNPDYNVGYYGYFKLDDDFNLELRNEESLDASNIIPFIFRHNSDDLQDIIDQADEACNTNSNLEITFFSEKGWTYTCN